MFSKKENLKLWVLGLCFLIALMVVALFFPSSVLPSTENKIYKECGKTQAGAKETCYSRAFEKLAYTDGPSKAFETLFNLQKLDREAVGCHFIAHGIGYGTYRQAPENWQRNFQSINQACSYGAMHGILEKRMLDDPESLKKERIRDICGTSPRGDCNHIVGHLALLLSENRIDKALDTCRGLSAGLQQFFCFSGVFMENITALNLIKHGYADESYLNWSARVPEIEKTCLSYEGDPAKACWEEMAHALAIKFRNNPAGVFEFCDRAPSDNFSSGCKRHSIGIMAASFQFDFKRASRICAVANNEQLKEECGADLVASTLATIPESGKEAVEFCNTLKDSGAQKCFEMIGNSLPPKEKDVVCQKATETYQNACLRGSSIPRAPVRYDQEF